MSEALTKAQRTSLLLDVVQRYAVAWHDWAKVVGVAEKGLPPGDVIALRAAESSLSSKMTDAWAELKRALHDHLPEC